MTEFLSVTSPSPVEAPSLGEVGEQRATEHLRANGYRIVLTNFKIPVGRNSKGVAVTGEIDIIALDGETLCFIEVKTRRSGAFASPDVNVDRRKQRQITRTAKVYRRLFNTSGMPYRYDVVTVLWPVDAGPTIEILRSYWTDAQFKKKNWSGSANWSEFT